MVDPRLVPLPAFEAIVLDALDALPPSAAPVLREVAVLVADEPPPGATPPGSLQLGAFHGIPLSRRGGSGRVPGSLPSTITLYRLPLLTVCPCREAVPGRVLAVLGHEVGHAFGLDEARLRELGWS